MTEKKEPHSSLSDKADVKKKKFFSYKNLKIIGIIITLISFYYIVRVFLKINVNFLEFENPILVIFCIFSLSFVYIFLMYLNSFLWKLILEFLLDIKLSALEVSRVYLKSNIAKYLPGNIMHLAGRNFLGNKYGWKHSYIALSSVLEILFVLIIGFTLSMLLTYREFVDFLVKLSHNPDYKFTLLIFSAVFLIAIFAGLLLLIKRREYINKFKKFFTKKFLFLFLKAIPVHIVTFFTLGLMLVIIYHFILGQPVGKSFILKIISAYIFSWIAGFITPGAPGGIGVRESVLLLMLSSHMGEANTLVAAMLHRLISLFGDFFSFLTALILDRFDGSFSSEMQISDK